RRGGRLCLRCVLLDLMQPPTEGSRSQAVEDEPDADQDREGGVADARVCDDHDAGDQLHEPRQGVPTAMLVVSERGCETDNADRDQPDPDQQGNCGYAADRMPDQEDPDDRGEDAEQG